MTTLTTTFNGLTLKALMLDTITHLKTGQHLDKNYITAKRTLCAMSGRKCALTSSELLTLIGMVYEDNKQEDVFWTCIDKFDAEKYLIQG